MRHAAGLLLAFAWAGCAAADGATTVERALARFVTAAGEHGGRVGVCITDVGSGATVASLAAEQGFVPASNTKLVTAAVALQSLGPDARLPTELLHTGSVRDGVLHGDLVLRGQGDPTLALPNEGDARLTGMVAALQALGVGRVAGRVVGDGSWLGDEHRGRGWQWDDLGRDYAPPFGGLCCCGNLEPVVRDGVAERVPVSDPAVFAAAAFAGVLRAAGIEVVGGDVANDGGERPVAVVWSRPLHELSVPLLLDSDNLFAEQLWRVAAKVATGDGGSSSAEAHCLAVLARLGVPTGGLVLADGSGLSRMNLVRPRQLAGLLCTMFDSPHRSRWLEALPIGGVSGTLRERFVDGPAHGRVLAKTGTLTRVTGLSGYLLRPQGEPLAFSILWNDFLVDDATARRTVDAFVQDLAAAVGW
jgi:D-alanyl-D-alanine carboxypeptidase/D-alanyl-D-alanine-endopeptidase (penicillin-binding protein 4)